MIARRAVAPSHVVAAHLNIFQNGHNVAFMYASHANGLDATRDANENIVVLTINERHEVAGFREFTGRIDPKWPEPRAPVTR